MKQKSGGLSLERFAKAKQSSYDKKAKKAKELALNAKKVNKYRKLKQKLAAKGLLAPRYTYERQVRRQGTAFAGIAGAVQQNWLTALGFPGGSGRDASCAAEAGKS